MKYVTRDESAASKIDCRTDLLTMFSMNRLIIGQSKLLNNFFVFLLNLKKVKLKLQLEEFWVNHVHKHRRFIFNLKCKICIFIFYSFDLVTCVVF